MFEARSLPSLLAAIAAAAICAAPWVAPALGSSFDGLELALPGAVCALALLSSVVASVRRAPPTGFSALRWAWALPAFTAMAIVPIASAWSSGRSNGAILLGVIPYSDAGDYVQGALRLLSEGALEPWSSRRPLNAALLAARLTLVDHSLERALALQALLLGLSVALGARAVALDLGHRAGLAVGAAVMVFGAIYTPTTLSESLGLTLGALALAILWHAARSASAWSLGVGLGALTVALNARAGPFFALATIALWAMWDSRRSLRALVSTTAASIIGVAAAFGFNRALLAIHHGNSSGTHGNFAYTLWGLAHGGVPWDRALARHPEVATMSDADAAAFLYARSFEAIRAQPSGLLRGFAENVAALAAMIFDPLSGDRLAGHRWIETALLLAALAPVVFFVRRALRAHPDDRALRLTLAASVGLALSVPVIFLDGRVRVFAAGFPLGVASIVALLTAPRRDPKVGVATHREAMQAPLWLLAGLLVAAIALPRIGRSAPRPGRVTCPRGQDPFALWTEGRFLQRHVVDGGHAVRDELVPRDTLLARIVRDPNLGYTLLDEQLRALRPGDRVVAALDLRARRFEYYVFAPGVSPRRRAITNGCAARPAPERRQFRRVMRAQ